MQSPSSYFLSRSYFILRHAGLILVVPCVTFFLLVLVMLLLFSCHTLTGSCVISVSLSVKQRELSPSCYFCIYIFSTSDVILIFLCLTCIIWFPPHFLCLVLLGSLTFILPFLSYFVLHSIHALHSTFYPQRCVTNLLKTREPKEELLSKVK